MPWTMFETAIGPCGLVWTDAGVSRLQLPEATRELTIERMLSRADEPGEEAPPPPWVKEAMALVVAHLDGRPQSFARVPLDLGGVTPFRAKVYRELQRVPAGSTISYGDLARAAGSPGASRAVGAAMATNPLPILVPCQRVLESSGKPGGFSAYGGLVTKERLLALEGSSLRPRQPPLFAAASGAALPYDRAEATRHLRAADPVLAAHVDAVGEFALSLKRTEGTFAALAESIVYQQLNGKAAATIFGRVRALFPKGRLDPRALLETSDAALRGAGLSKNKLAALRDLADKTVRGSIPTLTQLQKMDDEAIVEALTSVRGIGRWTVQMLLIFRLGRPDVLPVADFGIKKGFARVFHKGRRKDDLPTDADLIRRGERWRPFRSVASWYLWRAADAQVDA